MATSTNDLIIRPVRLEDAEALWTIARQEGIIETTMALTDRSNGCLFGKKISTLNIVSR